MREELAGTRPAIGHTIFEWRSSLSLARRIGLALGFACITGLLAQVRMPLPWTPVPITGQTFAVLMAGILLGRSWGGISQMMYLAIGLLGVPWFSGFTCGVGAIWGPTGGYLLGFIPAALFVGYMADRPVRNRRFVSFFTIMFVANFGLIHLPGLLHLRLWYMLALQQPIGLGALLAAGTIPFIPGGLIKVAAASGIATALAPRAASDS